MTQKLIIQNFGPIRDAEIEARDLTVFVGPQATGKSLTAQVLYFLSRIEESIFSRDHEPETPEKLVESALSWWLGNPTSTYVTSNTTLYLVSPSIPDGYRLHWTKTGLHLNKPLRTAVQKRQEWNPKDSLFARVYIPAGRSLYSFVPPSAALGYFSRSRSAQDWPGYIVTFYRTLEETIQWLWREQKQRQETLFDRSSDRFLRSRVDSIFKGQIQYGSDSVLLEAGNHQLRPVTIAAGQMELWPFWAMIEQYLKVGVTNSEVYFEEPEAHLHPSAQRSIMEIIAYLVREGARFLVTTHSPYVLYAINNFLMANKVLEVQKSLPKDIPQEISLPIGKVAAYRFSDDGTVHNLMDDEVGLIDENELDDTADKLGATFTRLQEKLQDYA